MNGSSREHDKKNGEVAESATDREAKERSARLLSPTPRLANGVQVVPHVPKRAQTEPPKDAEPSTGVPTPAPRVATSPNAAPPPAVIIESTKPSRNDQTLLMTPTPKTTVRTEDWQAPPRGQEDPRPKTAPVPRTKTSPGTRADTPAAAAPAPVPAAPKVPVEPRITFQQPRRAKSSTADTIAEALREVTITADAPPDGRSTAADLEAAGRLFQDLAVGHVTQVRDVMLELQLGDVPCAWVESTKPALRSLRAMAEQMEQMDLVLALDEFCTAVDAAVASGQAQVTDARKNELTRRYQRLIDLIPKAFELDAERDRREPVIVECLLRQVDGVEDLAIGKLFAVGLNRLQALFAATADDMAATSGIRFELAKAIVTRLKTYKDSATSTMTAPDAAAEHRELRTLVAAMRKHHEAFERASTGWTEEARTKKRDERKERDQTFLRVKLVLARLGERDRITRLDRVPFSERLADLDRYVAELARPRSGQLSTTQG